MAHRLLPQGPVCPVVCPENQVTRQMTPGFESSISMSTTSPLPTYSPFYGKLFRIYGRKYTKITNHPAELLLKIFSDSDLTKQDLVNMTLVCSRLNKLATDLLFRKLSTTILKNSSFDMPWSQLLNHWELSDVVQVVRLKSSERNSHRGHHCKT